MKILALETTGSACSVALWRDGGVVARRFEAMTRGHAERLVPMIGEVLAEAGVTAEAVDRLAVTVGPGAFTGLRVGLATARGLALATGRPLVGVTTFEAIAHALPLESRRGRSLLVAVDSRRTELFLRLFDATLTLTPSSLDGDSSRLPSDAGPPSRPDTGDVSVSGLAGIIPAGLDGDSSRLPSDAGRAHPRPWLRVHEDAGPPSRPDTGDASVSRLAGITHEPPPLSPEACARWLPPGPLLVAGCGAAALRDILGDRPDTVFTDDPGWADAAVVADFAAQLAPGAGWPPRPLYLRAPDATLPGEGRRS